MDRSSLIDDLIAWSIFSDLPPVPPQPDFDQWSRYLGTLFRFFASINDQWLWSAFEKYPNDILQLSPFIGTFDVLGCTFPPPSMSWPEWMRHVELASEIEAGIVA